MSDNREHLLLTGDQIRLQAEAKGLTFAEDRLQQIADAVSEAIAETDAMRTRTTPWPKPAVFDPSWSRKR